MTPTLRYSLIYGGLASIVLAAFIAAVGFLNHRVEWVATETFGYSVMLVAMSFVFVGVKRYRDIEGGGVIRFWHALGLGLSIALIASIAYVLIWELYLAVTNYRFMDDFIAGVLAKARASGKSAAEIAKLRTDLDAMRTMYANPLIRLSMTAMEILPVAVPVALASTIFCNPRFLPARAAVRAARPSPSPTGPA